MGMSEPIKEKIYQRAEQLGFDLCRIAPAVSALGYPHLQSWLSAGYAGQMQYIPNREQAYKHPRSILPAVRSVIMTATCYSRTITDNLSQPGRIARYAQGERDYHDVLRKMLKQLANYLHELSPGCVTRPVVDTAPLLERDFARLAGLGWFGKNTMLINKHKGSNFFIAALLCDLDLPADLPFETSHCGTCTRCLDVCPTDAFVKEYVLDARKCISYFTIEQRHEPIPLQFRDGIQDWIFGCDLCQEVCPWNRHAPACRLPELIADPSRQPSAAEFLVMSDEEFRKRFKKTPLWRTGRIAIARNAAIVLGNSQNAQYLDILERSLQNESPLIRGAVVWAVGQLGNQKSWNKLHDLTESETDQTILQEIGLAQQEIAKRLSET